MWEAEPARDGNLWVVVLVKSFVNKQVGSWLAAQEWTLNNQSEARSASWHNSWQWLKLINFRPWSLVARLLLALGLLSSANFFFSRFLRLMEQVWVLVGYFPELPCHQHWGNRQGHELCFSKNNLKHDVTPGVQMIIFYFSLMALNYF